jgi:hypothetical protein
MIADRALSQLVCVSAEHSTVRQPHDSRRFDHAFASTRLGTDTFSSWAKTGLSLLRNCIIAPLSLPASCSPSIVSATRLPGAPPNFEFSHCRCCECSTFYQNQQRSLTSFHFISSSLETGASKYPSRITEFGIPYSTACGYHTTTGSGELQPSTLNFKPCNPR